MHTSIWRQVVRQKPPRTSCPQEVEDGVEDLSTLVLGRTTPWFDRRDQMLYLSPFIICQVGGVALSGLPLRLGSPLGSGS